MRADLAVGGARGQARHGRSVPVLLEVGRHDRVDIKIVIVISRATKPVRLRKLE